jgi:hypothetical protein
MTVIHSLIRIVSIYSLPWHYRGTSSRDLPEELQLGELLNHYELYREQLPRLLPNQFLGWEEDYSIELMQPVDGIAISKTDAMLFALPSNQVVLAVVIEFSASSDADGLNAITRVLEQSIEGAMKITETGLSVDRIECLPVGQPDHSDWERDALGASALLPERHQLVFIADRDAGAPAPDAIDQIIYRKNPPYRSEFARLQRPEQLNRDGGEAPGTLAVVSPYVSLLYGHKPYVEDSIFLSTVHAVGTSSTFRQIWHDSYKQVRTFRDQDQAKIEGQQTRGALERLADNLGNLEFDLTFSVEFPLMRIETFHTALYEAMDLSGQARALSQMFNQLGGSLRSEITAIDVRERRRDEGRQKWNAFAAGILSLVGVSVGFVIAFLGINTTEVPDHKYSMWNPRFATIYLLAGLFALIPGYLILVPYLRDWVNKRMNLRPLWTGLVSLAAGTALFVYAVADADVSGRQHVIDAIMKSIAVLGLLIGTSLVILHLWKPLSDRLHRKRDRQSAGTGVGSHLRTP